MKKLIIFLMILICAVSCSTQPKVIQVPVETVRTEYINKTQIQHDSIFVKDSIDRYTRNDTVFIEKYRDRYKYKDRIITDTVCKTDSVQVPVPVEVIKEVNKLKGYQTFLMYTGVAFLLLLVYWMYKFIRKLIK